MARASSSIPVERLPVRLEADDDWVITLPFFHGGEARVRSVFKRVAQLSDDQVELLFGQVQKNFKHRHDGELEDVLDEHFGIAAKLIDADPTITTSRRRLLGSYFTMEYSIASAALFNPSIVPHPSQHRVPKGGLRFLMSLRATGEGHLSSIVFRTGVIQPDHSVQIDTPKPMLQRLRSSPDRQYLKHMFRRKLKEMSINQAAVDLVTQRLPERFSLAELDHAVDQALQKQPGLMQVEETQEGIRWLARENYELVLPRGTDISQVVIFPQSDNESRGIEDLRMVRFVDDDGSVAYYGTYSAYNGYRVLPQIMETTDLRHIGVHTMNGACVQNKGMALFPRRINGHYVMCSRIDGENLYIMYSDIVQFWETAELLRAPQHAWEFMQLGNCGSPLETPAGWLLLTHGVGPMRTYSIGAMLLDLDNPSKVIGHLDEPLLMPTDEERAGYVPNVVYTCGALIHNDVLFMPYAMSDSATGFALMPLDKLLERLVN
ncbi:MAG TPA: glycoside hydrolase family 130 protein [Pirellulales bacterium]|nr:glycoside hydrolase family 130 protein [Pirellulales bacterium]